MWGVCITNSWCFNELYGLMPCPSQSNHIRVTTGSELNLIWLFLLILSIVYSTQWTKQAVWGVFLAAHQHFVCPKREPAIITWGRRGRRTMWSCLNCSHVAEQGVSLKMQLQEGRQMEDKKPELQKQQGQMENRPIGVGMRSEMHNSSMYGTAGAKAKLGFYSQGSQEPLFQSVALLWFKFWSLSFCCQGSKSK